jgi:hypothetical protein
MCDILSVLLDKTHKQHSQKEVANTYKIAMDFNVRQRRTKVTSL